MGQYSVLKKVFCDKARRFFDEMWKKLGQEIRAREPEIIRSPFKDTNNTSGEHKSTRLSPKQASYFMFIFSLNMLVFFGNVAVLFVMFSKSVDKKRKIDEIVDAIGLSSQFASLLCAILSCFIFSKLAYSVSSTCTHTLPKLYMKVNEASIITRARVMQAGQGQAEIVNVQGQEIVPQYGAIDANQADSINYLKDRRYITQDDIDKNNSLHLLKAIANWYTRLVHSTLHPFGTWFAVHWVLYTMSAFMSISYLIETIILELYGHEDADRQCHGEHTMACRLRLSYAFLFAINHCILFLYPCFRAASVTTAYTSMIKRVSRAEWGNVSLDDKENFISYLKLQDCTFKVSILCAKLSFGFYIAYFSIFVGIFGVILKLAL